MSITQTQSSRILPTAASTVQKTPQPTPAASVDPQTQKLHTLGRDVLTFGSMTTAAAGALDLLNTTLSTGSFKISAPSNLLLGASFGVGMVLAKTDLGDKKLNHAKSLTAGALVGGSTVGLMSVVVRNIMAGAGAPLVGASPIAYAVGAVVGMGIVALPPTGWPHLMQR